MIRLIQYFQSNPFVSITVVVFSTLLLFSGVQHGLFMDGLIYSAVAHNMANGYGTFLEPMFTHSTINPFHEHPPLAFGIQAVFFKIFGHSFWIEKFYSILMAVIIAFIIRRIWCEVSKETGVKDERWWIVILFWITIPICFWSFRNNMLENTMGMFSILSFYLMYAARNSQQKFSFVHISAGAILVLSFLSKGFPGLFPLAAPILLFLFYKKQSFAVVVWQNAQVILGFLLLLLLALAIPGMLENLKAYFNIQLLPSLSGETVVVRRTVIFESLISQVIGHILLSAVGVFISYKLFHRKIEFLTNQKRSMYFFLVVGLSATLPIMLSPKQLGFYITPSLPYYMLALVLLMYSICNGLVVRLQQSPIWNTFRKISFVLLLVPIIVSILFAGKISRDREVFSEVRQIGEHLGSGKEISLSSALYPEWGLMGYLQRYYFIGCKRAEEKLPYLLLMKKEALPDGYEDENINLKTMRLAHKKENLNQ
jgi:4-amino-4-deoxy-L-arabinose transferase-like glycosyltransferase